MRIAQSLTDKTKPECVSMHKNVFLVEGEKKKKQKMIYNSLIMLETTCTQLVGEKGAQGKLRKEQSLGQPDICFPVYGKIFS